jgi:hypothetical protein
VPDGVQATFGLRSVHPIATILGVTGLMDEAGLKSAGVRFKTSRACTAEERLAGE